MQRIKKSIATLFANCVLLQNINVSLFKANIRKITKIKIKKEKKVNAIYGSAFGKVLTPAQATAARNKAFEKEDG